MNKNSCQVETTFIYNISHTQKLNQKQWQCSYNPFVMHGIRQMPMIPMSCFVRRHQSYRRSHCHLVNHRNQPRYVLNSVPDSKLVSNWHRVLTLFFWINSPCSWNLRLINRVNQWKSYQSPPRLAIMTAAMMKKKKKFQWNIREILDGKL